MMASKKADSVRFEVYSQPPDKKRNEARLVQMAAEFFGREPSDHNGFRHDPEPYYPCDENGEIVRPSEPGEIPAKVPTLRTYTVFYDETPYEG